MLAAMVTQDNNDIFMAVLNRWRSLGGLLTTGINGVKSIVQEGDELAIRKGDWLYLTPGDNTLEQVKALNCTRVLDATFGQPGREGIESYGDWEITVDLVEKSESCRDLVDLTLTRIGGGEYEDCDGMERGATMLDARAFMRRMEPSWDLVLDRMGKDLNPNLFNAENTTVKECVTYEDDGNEFVALVDVGTCIFICTYITS
mgnify:FL=1